jgi:hypothetical protein
MATVVVALHYPAAAQEVPADSAIDDIQLALVLPERSLRPGETFTVRLVVIGGSEIDLTDAAVELVVPHH